MASFISTFGDRKSRGPSFNAYAVARRQDALRRRAAEAKIVGARFGRQEMQDLQGLALTENRRGNSEGTRAYAILSHTIRCDAPGCCAIAPKPEAAAFLAAFLRNAGVTSVACPALAQLDALAAAAPLSGSSPPRPIS